MCPNCDAAIPAKDIHSPAARDVLAERQRQVEVEGWTAEHDDMYSHGELAIAAARYAQESARENQLDSCPLPRPSPWPWPAKWWKPGAPRRMLVKAGALILAEIERLDRANLLAQQQEGGQA
ncbi:hypothetical protein FQZ97_958280 [compost metagenome]